jgi:hypothetical protein
MSVFDRPLHVWDGGLPGVDDGLNDDESKSGIEAQYASLALERFKPKPRSKQKYQRQEQQQQQQ